MSDQQRPRRLWGRWLAIGVAALVMLVVMAYTVHDQSVRGGVAGVGRELDATDPGWRLKEILAVRPEVDPADNSVSRVLEVTAKFPARWPDEKLYKKLQEMPPNALADAATRAELDGLLKGAAREAARELVRYPRGHFEFSASTPLWAAVPELERAHKIAPLLELDALALAQDGRSDDALASARTMLSLARSLEQDPSSPGQLLRLWVRGRAFDAVTRALALGEPSDAALASVGGDAGPYTLTRSMRTERAVMHETLSAVSRGEVDPLAITRPMGVRTPDLYAYGGPMLRRELVRREHAHLLRLLTRMIESSRLPPARQFAEDDAIEREFKGSFGLFTKLEMALLTGTNGFGRRNAAAGAAFRTMVAVERHRRKHGKWPATLEDLVPDFLETKPEDPIDGATLRYKRTADGAVMYSIGNDRADDGGDVVPDGKDIGYRLWDAAKRRVKP